MWKDGERGYIMDKKVELNKEISLTQMQLSRLNTG